MHRMASKKEAGQTERNTCECLTLALARAPSEKSAVQMQAREGTPDSPDACPQILNLKNYARQELHAGRV